VTRAEIVVLLTRMSTYDLRKFGDADVEAWYMALDDLPSVDEAMAAVVAHYRESTDKIMPAHVRQGVKAMRQARRRNEPHPIRELPSRFERDMGEQVRVARGAATVRDVLGPVLEHIARQSAGQPAAVSAIDQLRAITAGPGWDTDTIDGEVIE
jgi:hypothetical protein